MNLRRNALAEILSVTTAICLLSLVMTNYCSSIPEAQATVLVNTVDSKGSAVNIGNGMYVTAFHVIEDNVKQGIPIVKLTNDQGDQVPAIIRFSKPENDIAVLFTLDEYFTKQMFVNCDTLPVGAKVLTIGNPYYFNFLEFEGNISGKKFKWSYWPEVYPVAGTIIPGMSGGALVDDTGRLAGVNIGYQPFTIDESFLGGRDQSYINISFAVPTDVVCKMMTGEIDFNVYQILAKK
ncbi:putative trypsin-like peptidase protein [Rhizobium phage RHph_Y68]|uniref:Putative trypsin-like peptidase protein n=1 Tax=Rhizobium phage RHph_Y68 TaxID=2509787 RepID=A0A7S5QXV7_9CAUD|nr:protease [Rhizobium phage RHph_Y68]QIG67977.1 putative trypsin-like peptidase protein [Rhizobium phage RHph_Y68]